MDHNTHYSNARNIISKLSLEELFEFIPKTLDIRGMIYRFELIANEKGYQAIYRFVDKDGNIKHSLFPFIESVPLDYSLYNLIMNLYLDCVGHEPGEYIYVPESFQECCDNHGVFISVQRTRNKKLKNLDIE